VASENEWARFAVRILVEMGHVIFEGTGVRFNSSSLPASDCNVDGYLSFILAAI
jgi:hypothetical protein